MACNLIRTLPRHIYSQVAAPTRRCLWHLSKGRRLLPCSSRHRRLNAAKHSAEVTRVAWNSQVSHILATASQSGATIVWDLRQKKPWCELTGRGFRGP